MSYTADISLSIELAALNDLMTVIVTDRYGAAYHRYIPLKELNAISYIFLNTTDANPFPKGIKLHCEDMLETSTSAWLAWHKFLCHNSNEAQSILTNACRVEYCKNYNEYVKRAIYIDADDFRPTKSGGDTIPPSWIKVSKLTPANRFTVKAEEQTGFSSDGVNWDMSEIYPKSMTALNIGKESIGVLSDTQIADVAECIARQHDSASYSPAQVARIQRKLLMNATVGMLCDSQYAHYGPQRSFSSDNKIDDVVNSRITERLDSVLSYYASSYRDEWLHNAMTKIDPLMTNRDFLNVWTSPCQDSFMSTRGFLAKKVRERIICWNVDNDVQNDHVRSGIINSISIRAAGNSIDSTRDYLGAMRSMLTFTNTMAAVKNAVGHPAVEARYPWSPTTADTNWRDDITSILSAYHGAMSIAPSENYPGTRLGKPLPKEPTMYPTQDSINNNEVLHAISAVKPLQTFLPGIPNSLTDTRLAVVVDGTDESICYLIKALYAPSAVVDIIFPTTPLSLAASYYNRFFLSIATILKSNQVFNSLASVSTTARTFLGDISYTHYVDATPFAWDRSRLATYRALLINSISALQLDDGTALLPAFGLGRNVSISGNQLDELIRQLSESILTQTSVATFSPADIASHQLVNRDVWEAVSELQLALVGIHYGLITEPYVDPEEVLIAPKKKTTKRK